MDALPVSSLNLGGDPGYMWSVAGRTASLYAVSVGPRYLVTLGCLYVLLGCLKAYKQDFRPSDPMTFAGVG